MADSDDDMLSPDYRPPSQHPQAAASNNDSGNTSIEALQKELQKERERHVRHR